MEDKFLRKIYYYKDYYLDFYQKQKSAKTPKNEIELAEKLKKEYLYEKYKR